MFQAKAIYNTGVEEINMPDSWDCLPFKTYCELVNNDDATWFKRISILTGIDEDNVKMLSTDMFSILMSRAAFLNDIESLKSSLHVPDRWKDFKIGSVEIGSFISAQQELERVRELGLNQVNAGKRIVQLFTQIKGKDHSVPGWNIDDEPVTKCLGLVDFFLLKLESS